MQPVGVVGGSVGFRTWGNMTREVNAGDIQTAALLLDSALDRIIRIAARMESPAGPPTVAQQHGALLEIQLEATRARGVYARLSAGWGRDG